MATRTLPPPSSRLRISLPPSLSVLAERDFRLIWLGSAVSLTGTWMQVIAQGIIVLTLWDSAFALGIISFANMAPSLVVMLFGGVAADRAEKRLILIMTQCLMAGSAGVVGLLVLLGALQFWMLVAVALALGIVIGYDMPAYQALLPELVPPEKIGQVVALNSSTFHGSRMIGPAIAGMVIAAVGYAAAYFMNALSFLAVIFSLLLLKHRRASGEPGERRPSALEGLREGIAHARARPNLQAMLMLTALNTTFVFPSIAVLMPFYAKDVLGRGATTLGLLMAAAGVGSMFGALLLIWWAETWREARIWFGAVAAPVALVILSLSRSPAISIAAAGLASFAFSSQLGLIQMMIQESTPPRFRGRVMSLHGITFSGSMPLAGLISAGAVVAFGLPFVMAASALIFVLASVCVLRYAGGGIGQVVRESSREYEAVMAGGAPNLARAGE
ncbi:MAG: MFS transporter [Dehalococcoidia bacterium]|nr:MFS transporter [Dehalococcoidia bacterium]